MKLSSALILAASAGIASAKRPARKAIDVSATQKVGGAAARKLMRAARRLEDEEQQNDNQAEEEEYAYLQNYRMKFVQCVPDYQVSAADGEAEGSAVIFRLCPNDAESQSAFGCTDEEA